MSNTLIILLTVLSVAVVGVIVAIIAFIVLDFKKQDIKPAKKSKKNNKAAVKKVPQKKVQEVKKAPVSQPQTTEIKPEVKEEETLIQPVAEEMEADANDEEIMRVKAVTENGKTRYIIIKYSKSFLAKLIQSDEETKKYYSQIKNTLLSYKGVKSRISWRWETFRLGRKALAKLRLRGKTLSLALALNAADYEETKYHVEDVSDIKSCAETPCLYRIKNDRRLKYSADLIAAVMSQNGAPQLPEAQNTDYASQYPYETTEALIGRKLIKELTDEEAQSGTEFKPRKSITVQEADTLMQDEVAVALVEKSGKTADRTKADIINIDTLSQYFNDGETVTLEEIKKRVPGFSARTTYIKVLARGILDKSLTVYADSFSLQAVKMIVLTGGKAIRD